MFFGPSRVLATRNSGDPTAWRQLTTWITFHHATLINATLACFLQKKKAIPDIADTHILFIALLYRHDPTLPVERRFEVQDAQLVHKDEPSSAGGPTYGQLVFMDRGTAVEMGRMELGKDYWGTGAYILSTRFKEENVQALPFWKHFAIDKQHSRAKLTCNPPLALLRRNIHEGFKLRFCCGRIEGMPTCCCGGWTHEKVRSLLLAYR